jgi:acetyltransferase-like isoleucine patch superfamily enzyme/acyl carrier protein
MLVSGHSGIEIGARAIFLGGAFATELRCEDGAQIGIGCGTVLMDGVSVVAARSVRIGANCKMGSLVRVRDNDGRRTAPVTIFDEVRLGRGAMVEPGSVVGRGAVVAAGAVVCGTVPDGAFVIGNPARYELFEKGQRRDPNGVLDAVERGHEKNPKGGGLDAACDGGGGGEHALRVAAPNDMVSAHVLRIAAGDIDDPERPSPRAIRMAIIEWLDDTRHFGEAESRITSDAMSLREGGLLDSLGLVQLVQMLEKKFGIPIDRERMAAPDSRSIDAFVRLIMEPTPEST